MNEFEQQRRDLKSGWPALYAYIELFITARALNRAGDRLSARAEYGAANLLYSMSGEIGDEIANLDSPDAL